jgi:molybdopterin converting factor subunit 1
VEIDLRYFAIIREIVGQAAERRELPEKTTVSELLDRQIAEHPRLERVRPETMLMVNRSYVPADHELRAGDEVALIPPVSGGGQGRFYVQSEELDVRAIEALVAAPGAGAIVTFVGTVRDSGRGLAVTRLEYEAYAPAAEQMLEQIGQEIWDRWQLDQLAIAHRVGILEVGEASVVISVASAHRGPAFEACRYAIERIKEIVPIWKKEHYADGALWIGSEHDYQVETGRIPSVAEG